MRLPVAKSDQGSSSNGGSPVHEMTHALRHGSPEVGEVSGRRSIHTHIMRHHWSVQIERVYEGFEVIRQHL